MYLVAHVLEGLKGALTHNTAKRLLHEDKSEAKAYLAEAESLLLEMRIDTQQVAEIIQYARMKARSEVKIIRQMYSRYGIVVDVADHGGSEIALQTLIEIAIAQGE